MTSHACLAFTVKAGNAAQSPSRGWVCVTVILRDRAVQGDHEHVIEYHLCQVLFSLSIQALSQRTFGCACKASKAATSLAPSPLVASHVPTHYQHVMQTAQVCNARVRKECLRCWCCTPGMQWRVVSKYGETSQGQRHITRPATTI